MFAIEARELTRVFGDHVAVDRLTLRVPEGRIFGYLGLNGAGKTTTIKMLTTLLSPSSGSARVLGHDVVAEPLAVRRELGFLGEDGLESHLSWTASEYLGYFAGLRGLPNRRNWVDGVLDAVGLERPWRRRPLGTYSSGMRRRVELARALLGRPRLLCLDEPTRGLDLSAKRNIWNLVRGLVAKSRVTVFLSSHELTEILAVCQDLGVIAQGRLQYQGPLAGLGRDPQSVEARLLALLEGRNGAGADRGVRPVQARVLGGPTGPRIARRP